MDRVDIHFHLLPGLDDGPEDLEEALATAERAIADGTRTVVCTPHFDERRAPSIASLRTAVADLQAVLDLRQMPLALVAGAEVLLGPDLPELAAAGRLPTIGDGPYMLIEFPFFTVPTFAEQVIFELQTLGLRPILAHPERCAPLAGAPDRLNGLIERGLLVQINAASLTGEHGRDARRAARHFLTRGHVHVIASDGHSPTGRPPLLSRGETEAATLVGGEAARAMVTTLPAAIATGAELPALSATAQPLPTSRRWPLRLPFRR